MSLEELLEIMKVIAGLRLQLHLLAAIIEAEVLLLAEPLGGLVVVHLQLGAEYMHQRRVEYFLLVVEVTEDQHLAIVKLGLP